MSLCELSKMRVWLMPFNAAWDNDQLPVTIFSKQHGQVHDPSSLQSPSGLGQQLLDPQISLYAFMMCLRTHITSIPFYSLLWWAVTVLFWMLWTAKEQNSNWGHHLESKRDTGPSAAKCRWMLIDAIWLQRQTVTPAPVLLVVWTQLQRGDPCCGEPAPPIQAELAMG